MLSLLETGDLAVCSAYSLISLTEPFTDLQAVYILLIGMSSFFYFCTDVDLFNIRVAAKRLNGFVKVILKGIIFSLK